MVSRIAQAPPVRKATNTIAASARSNGRSTESARTTVNTLPTACARTPQTRTMELQNTTRPAPGIRKTQPRPCSNPNRLQIAAPATVKTSSAGTRLRTGPPVSQKQVSMAAKATIRTAGDLSQMLAKRTSPVATAARKPSEMLTLARSSPIGIRLRSGPGTRRCRSGPSGRGRGPSRQARNGAPETCQPEGASEPHATPGWPEDRARTHVGRSGLNRRHGAARSAPSATGGRPKHPSRPAGPPADRPRRPPPHRSPRRCRRKNGSRSPTGR